MLGSIVSVFPAHEQRRVESQSLRYDIAMEDARQALAEHMSDYLSTEVSSSWGEPDRARNALASISHALSTPGHYGRAPRVVARDQAVANRLNDVMAPVWSRQQHVEYLLYACGSVATMVDLATGEEDDRDGEMALTIKPAHLCWAIAGDDATKPVVFRHLLATTVTTSAAGKTQAYVWVEWDIRNPVAPVWRVVLAEQGGGLGEDVTAQVAPRYDGVYRWTRAGGAPYIPWTIHRSFDVGDLWNAQRGGSAARGTLTCMMLWSAANTAALRSTGKVVLLMDAVPLATRTITKPDGTVINSFDAQPGAIVQLRRTDPQTQPMAVEVGEVDTLPALSTYAQMYGGQLAQDMGVTPSDATRVGANPMSGAALAITNETKRLEQRRRGELARQADMHTLRCVCWLLSLSTDGLGILYDEIELSAQEQRADLEVDQKELDMGIASPIDILMRRRPGLSRDQAIAELLRIRADAEMLRAPSPPAAPTPGA